MNILKYAQPDRLVIIEFTSPVCTVCDNIKPFLQKLKNAYQNKFTIVEVDAIANFSTAEQLFIQDLPTFIFLKDNKLVDRINGFIGENKFEKIVRIYI